MLKPEWPGSEPPVKKSSRQRKTINKKLCKLKSLLFWEVYILIVAMVAYLLLLSLLPLLLIIVVISCIINIVMLSALSL